MSSASSYDGSDKDHCHHRHTSDELRSRKPYLSKTDLLDLNDSSRSSRDADTWSVAAVMDDQDSVISSNTQKSRLLPDIELSTFDDHTIISQLDARSTTTSRSLTAEYEFSLANNNNDIEHGSGNDDDDDDDDMKNYNHDTAERGIENDDQPQQDYQHLCGNDNDQAPHPRQHHDRRCHQISSTSPVTMEDSIRAPTEPQPSFTAIGKTYEELMEENEWLHAQLRHLEITAKHRQNIIGNRQPYHSSNNNLCVAELNSNVLSKQLAIWAERIIHFAGQCASASASGSSTIHQRQVEHGLFHHVIEYYLHVLPFGTDNQLILNTAYQDQLTRFHTTLGTHFAKWYRRQTVQSLTRNMATHDYLEVGRILMTQQLCRTLSTTGDSAELLTASKEWHEILDDCATLALELHSSEHDVLIRSLSPGSLYDDTTMMAVSENDDDMMDLDHSTTTTAIGKSKYQEGEQRRIKSIVCPLFIDEQDTVLLPARVILE